MRLGPEELDDIQGMKKEEVSMFGQLLENIGKVTGATVTIQQDIFKKWFTMWPAMPGLPTDPASAEQMEKFQKRWAATVSELLRRHRDFTETQFKAGMENIERAFQIGEAKTAEEIRARTIELWQKWFESMRQTTEGQIRETQVATQKWFELLTTPVPC
jgi:hypothetical protein